MELGLSEEFGTIELLCIIRIIIVTHGCSAVECRTRNQESLGSNPHCCRFEVWAFSFSARCPSSLRSEYLAIGSGGNVNV